MRFLLDNNIAAAVAVLLVEAGRDTDHVRDHGMQAATDEEVLACQAGPANADLGGYRLRHSPGTHRFARSLDRADSPQPGETRRTTGRTDLGQPRPGQRRSCRWSSRCPDRQGRAGPPPADATGGLAHRRWPHRRGGPELRLGADRDVVGASPMWSRPAPDCPSRDTCPHDLPVIVSLVHVGVSGLHVGLPEAPASGGDSVATTRGALMSCHGPVDPAPPASRTWNS